MVISRRVVIRNSKKDRDAVNAAALHTRICWNVPQTRECVTLAIAAVILPQSAGRRCAVVTGRRVMAGVVASIDGTRFPVQDRGIDAS